MMEMKGTMRMFLAAFVALSAMASRAPAASTGTLVNTLGITVNDMIADPNRPLIYALEQTSNTMAVINTNTWTVVNTIAVGTNPTGLAISPDDSTLYVADSSASNTISVISLPTLTPLTSIVAPNMPTDVAVGNGNRLYVSSPASGVMQFDTTTGALQATYAFTQQDGPLALSPDRNTLYVQSPGVSPITVRQLDVSTATATLLHQQSFTEGGFTRNAVSGNGNYVVEIDGYNIDELPSGNVAASPLQVFDVGAYPGPSIFSPDSSLCTRAKSTLLIRWTFSARPQERSWARFHFRSP